MHVAVFWEISDGKDAKRIRSQLESALAPFRPVRAVASFYIIQMDSEQQYQGLIDVFDKIIEENPQLINLFVSAPMQPRSYYCNFPEGVITKISHIGT